MSEDDVVEFEYEAAGLVLHTSRLRESVEFYSGVLRLPVRFRDDNKVCLKLGDAYLLLDASDDSAQEALPPVLQFRVHDVTVAAGQLSMLGVRVDLQSGDRGVRATFLDPDNNRCELLEAEEGFTVDEPTVKNPMPAPLRPRS